MLSAKYYEDIYYFLGSFLLLSIYLVELIVQYDLRNPLVICKLIVAILAIISILLQFFMLQKFQFQSFHWEFLNLIMRHFCVFGRFFELRSSQMLCVSEMLFESVSLTRRLKQMTQPSMSLRVVVGSLFTILAGFCSVDQQEQTSIGYFILTAVFIFFQVIQDGFTDEPRSLNQTVLRSPMLKQIDTSSFRQDFQDMYAQFPFGIAIVDSTCQVHYINKKISDIFQMDNMMLLTKALQTFQIQHNQKLKVSLNNIPMRECRTPRQIESRLSNGRSQALSQSSPLMTLSTFLQNYSSYLGDAQQPYVLLDKVKSSFLQNHIIGVAKHEESLSFKMEGRPYYLLFFLDIRDYHKSLSRQINAATMNQMFKSFSHEFRTSLNCIISLTRSAQSLIQDNMIVDQIINPTLDSCLIMDSIVKDFRDLNLFQCKRFDLQIQEEVNLQDLISSVQKLFERSIKSKQVEMRLFIDPKLRRPILTDNQRLKQVLLNLVSNSQKHTFKGSITIRALMCHLNNEEYVKIEVEDTGIGMTEQQKIALNEFLNLGAKYCTNSGSSQTFGLGLIISNLIAQRLSDLKRSKLGGVQFSSEFGKGSSFWFLIIDQKNVFNPADQFQPIIHRYRRSVYSREKEHLTKVIALESIKNSKVIRSQTSFESPGSPQSRFLKQAIKYNPSVVFEGVIPHSDDVYLLTNDLVPEEKSQVQVSEYGGNTIVRHPSASKNNRVSITERKSPQKCQCNEILIVDDEYFNQLALSTVLRMFKLQSDCSSNGFDAVEKFESNLTKNCPCQKYYRIIFMDINMPILDGFQATQKIIKTAQKYQIQPPPIIAQTAFVDYDTQRQSYDVGMKYFLAKPVSVDELRIVLTTFKII